MYVSDNKYQGRACAPSGASVGMYEAQSFIQNDPELTIENFKGIKNKFIGIDSCRPQKSAQCIKTVDPSDNYSTIGGSVAYALTIASVDSAAKAMNIPFYKVLNPKLDKD